MTDNIEVNEEELNRVCWCFVHGRNYHEYRAKEDKYFIENPKECDDPYFGDLDKIHQNWDLGYHTGMKNSYDESIIQLDSLSIEIEERAENYADEHGLEMGDEEDIPLDDNE